MLLLWLACLAEPPAGTTTQQSQATCMVIFVRKLPSTMRLGRRMRSRQCCVAKMCSCLLSVNVCTVFCGFRLGFGAARGLSCRVLLLVCGVLCISITALTVQACTCSEAGLRQAAFRGKQLARGGGIFDHGTAGSFIKWCSRIVKSPGRCNPDALSRM